MADLPMLPQHRKLVVIPQTARQFRVVQGLMKRSDITGLIIATDAGREGELVARWIMAKAGWNKPAKRLWISSQTDKAIRDGFADLRPAADYENLFRSAQARSEAKRILEQAQADADSLKAQTRQECSAMVEQAEQEVQQRWQTFDRKANALLDQYRSADSQPSEET